MLPLRRTTMRCANVLGSGGTAGAHGWHTTAAERGMNAGVQRAWWSRLSQVAGGSWLVQVDVAAVADR
jgi:hypothetical protein